MEELVPFVILRDMRQVNGSMDLAYRWAFDNIDVIMSRAPRDDLFNKIHQSIVKLMKRSAPFYTYKYFDEFTQEDQGFLKARCFENGEWYDFELDEDYIMETYAREHMPRHAD